MTTVQEIEDLSRNSLQALAKEHGIKANDKTTVIREKLIKLLVSSAEDQNVEESSVVEQDVVEVIPKAMGEVSSDPAIEKDVETSEVEEVGPVEEEEVEPVEEGVDQEVVDKVVSRPITQELEVPKREEAAVESLAEESESMKSPVQKKAKLSSKKKRLSTGKKSKKELTHTKIDAPAPPCETSEAPIMPPAPPAVSSAAHRPRMNKAAQLMMEARQKAKKAIEDEQKLEADKDSRKMIYNTYMNSKPRPTSINKASAITTKKAPAVEGSPEPHKAFKARPVPSFYSKAPKKTTTTHMPALADKENKAAKNVAPQSSTNFLERLTKPTAATKNSAVEKVVKKEVSRTPFSARSSAAPAPVFRA
jgi:hypothetical protein